MLSECVRVWECVGGVGNRAQRAVMRLLVLFINTHNIVRSLPHIVYDENIVYIAPQSVQRCVLRNWVRSASILAKMRGEGGVVAAGEGAL